MFVIMKFNSRGVVIKLPLRLKNMFFIYSFGGGRVRIPCILLLPGGENYF
jgi:hypothetical protein